MGTSTFSSTSLNECNHSRYLAYIRSCYRSFPEAAPYYEQLIDHLNLQRGAQLQSIQLLELEPPLDPSEYPVLLPSRPVEFIHEQYRPRVAILQGYPSPECIAHLGASFSIRPEFFIGHLSCAIPGSTRMPLEALSLPSSQENLVRIPFCIVARSPNPIDHLTSDVERALLTSEKKLRDEGRYGASRFRKVNIHDERTYSLEESMAFTIVQSDNKGHKWNAIILTDHGRPSTYQHGIPLNTYDENGRPATTLPIVPYDMPPDSSRKTSLSEQNTVASFSYCDPFHPLKKVALLDETDFQLVSEDPFFLLSSILRTSFLSWTQVLKVLANTVARCHDKLKLPQSQLHHYLSQLRACIAMVNHIKEVLLENQEIIRNGGHSKWPKASTEETRVRKLQLQSHLIADHECLLSRCDHLLVECESTTTALLGFAQLMASERSISQAKEVQRLTSMAAVFIPVTFATGIFGMNIKELEPAPRWWCPFAVALILVLFTVTWLRYKAWIAFLVGFWYDHIIRLWRDMRRGQQW
ncbi:unnamed protein product [Clonostachys rosea]|uniref:Uncharacterized protein n=1 Tax=Bionectria ochroleuca TaxID=29856 RepID=A0ABY6ULJ5_BIOOC|nr:unnamed protein product [Clonostachys rosea]